MTDIDPILKNKPKGANIIEDFDDSTFNATLTNNAKKINPLQKHFRIPGLSVKLPSQCYYYENNEVDTNLNGEIDVYPMTAGDELIMKNPDALLSGKAIESLIESCVPQVNNVRKLLAIDVDVLLLAIRSASYDNKMDLAAKCPKCSTENSFEIDTSAILANTLFLEPPYAITLKQNLIVYIKPYNFADQTKAAITAFEQTKKTQQLTSMSESELTPEKESAIRLQLAETVRTIIKTKYDLMANSITHIEVDDNTVTNKKQIIEFLENAPKFLIDKISHGFEQLNNFVPINRKQKVMCANQSCQHQWSLEVDFNPSNFFELG
ncbi:MAG: hypothetical protein HC836_26250 [Richelia sp. RM2_1_2]|nr:hypothetical protein [Richelia sp. RM2_1_2]